MSGDGDPVKRSGQPTRHTSPVTTDGRAVMCLFDGSAEALPRLRLAAAAAMAAGSRLLVAHVEKSCAGFWAAAFTGYGACLGPAEPLFSQTSEAAFSAAVEGLLETPVGWDFTARRGNHARVLRELTAAHGVAVVIVDNARLAERLTRDPSLTVLTV